MKRMICLLCALSFACFAAGCGAPNHTTTASAETTVPTETTQPSEPSTFSSQDKEIGYDASSAITILLSNQSVTIDQGGVYVLSGQIEDGQIIIAAPEQDEIQLVLDGVDIYSNTSAPLYVKSAGKVFVTLAPDSHNTLSVNGEYTSDENGVDGAVFSKSDITFNGSGSLTVHAAYGHGIVGKDEVTFTSGTYTINAQRHGISANDAVKIADGTFDITSGKDAIQAENTDDASLGTVYIANGSVTAAAQGDAISATGTLQIDGGYFALTTGAGAEAVASASPQPGMGFAANVSSDDTTSLKGLKSDSQIRLNGGTFILNTEDDAIHAGGDLAIRDGTYRIRSGDDGIHSDQSVTLEGGTFSIEYCLEGVEGLSIIVHGGTFDIVSRDDGFNAAGGTDSSGFGGRDDPFASTEGAEIVINGGSITVESEGDCLDSNGALTINGGTLNLTCNGNGNTAIDASGAYQLNGGEVTTNDGSESGNSMNMGRPGGPGGMRP